jgi:hypothetical protein
MSGQVEPETREPSEVRHERRGVAKRDRPSRKHRGCGTLVGASHHGVVASGVVVPRWVPVIVRDREVGMIRRRLVSVVVTGAVVSVRAVVVRASLRPIVRSAARAAVAVVVVLRHDVIGNRAQLREHEQDQQQRTESSSPSPSRPNHGAKKRVPKVVLAQPHINGIVRMADQNTTRAIGPTGGRARCRPKLNDDSEARQDALERDDSTGVKLLRSGGSSTSSAATNTTS